MGKFIYFSLTLFSSVIFPEMPPTDDIDELVTEFEDFGFPVTKYDGLNDA